MSSLTATTLLSQMSAEDLAKVIAATSDDKLTDVEKAARALGAETLSKFQQGGFQQPGYYALMIKSLAR